MDEIINWLMRDEQKDLFEFLVAMVMNLLFLALSALLLWPLGSLSLLFSLAKGYVVLWSIIFVSAWLLHLFQRFFRMNLYDRANAYIFSTLAVSTVLQIGWAAFAALAVSTGAAGSPIWLTVILYLLGGLSCLVAYYDVSSFYHGGLYRLFSLPLNLISFLIFSGWPAIGSLFFGWFFQLF